MVQIPLCSVCACAETYGSLQPDQQENTALYIPLLKLETAQKSSLAKAPLFFCKQIKDNYFSCCALTEVSQHSELSPEISCPE
jgi:hypothetical protein